MTYNQALIHLDRVADYLDNLVSADPTSEILIDDRRYLLVPL